MAYISGLGERERNSCWDIKHTPRLPLAGDILDILDMLDMLDMLGMLLEVLDMQSLMIGYGSAANQDCAMVKNTGVPLC